MKQRLAAYTAEVLFPEREKFTAPLLLLPGLWTGSLIWQEVAWGFSQRGWSCWALDLYGQSAFRRRGDVSLDDHLTTITTATAAFDCPPIVIGFDSRQSPRTPRHHPRTTRVPSSVFLPCCPATGKPTYVRPCLWYDSPPCPRSCGNRAHPPPSRSACPRFSFSTRFRRGYTTSYTISLSRTPAESSAPSLEARSIFRYPPLPCPSLVVWGQEDRMVPAPAARWLADALEAASLSYPDQGHWLLAGPTGGDPLSGMFIAG